MAEHQNVEIDAIRSRLDAAVEAWSWHEGTDELMAGYGHHMSQMLYRLPADAETRDMKTSIDSMIRDLHALLDALSTPPAATAAGDDRG